MLVKFCKPEHNPLTGCNSIRFGTVEYYRKLDASFLIADPDEGVDTHTIDNPGGIPTDRETIDFLNSTRFLTPDTYIQGITLRRTFPNCYVWCCKNVVSEPGKDEGSQFDPAYSSFYKVPNPNTFSQYLAGLLIQSLKRVNFSEEGRKILDDLTLSEYNVNLAAFHGPVIYVEKKQGSLTFGRFQTYAEKVPPHLRQMFVKSSKYAADSEYRFAFVVLHQQRGVVIPVGAQPVDIRAVPIQ
jgi:hypothetical protein